MSESFDGKVTFVRLGSSKPINKDDEIRANKVFSEVTKEVTKKTKRDTCFLCGEVCSSFCNSHSVPQFMLARIAEGGKVLSFIQNEMTPHKTDPGVKRAGTFQLICETCDNTMFQDYESPESYNYEPSNTMMAQIALKNYLHMIWKRTNEIEYYKTIPKYFPGAERIFPEKLYFAKRDLRDYNKLYNYAKKSLKNKNSKDYYLCFYRKLDYVVPYASQAAITLFNDFEGGLINNLFIKKDSYAIECIHVCVFPLKNSSVVMAFVEAGNKRYRKFYKQLNRLHEEDQLAAINYIVFCNTENVYANMSLADLPRTNSNFRDVCTATFDYTIKSADYNPTKQAFEEFGLFHRNEIPNLLSRDYALMSKQERAKGK